MSRADVPAPTRAESAIRTRASATFLASMIAVACFVAWDVFVVVRRTPRLDDAVGLVLFATFGVAFGSVLVTPVALAHAALRRRLHGASIASHALVGALEGTVLYAIGLLGQDPHAIQGDARVYLLLASALGVGLLRVGLRGLSPALGLPARAAIAGLVLVASVAVCAILRWNGYEWVRVALDLAAVLAVARLLAPSLASRRMRVPAAVASVAVVVVTLASGALFTHHDARRILHRRSAHVRSWTSLVDALVDVDGDGATNLFGGVDCAPRNPRVHPRAHEVPGNGIDENCSGGDPPKHPAPEPSAATVFHGIARGRDVLLLTFDSFRADALQAIEPLRATLGPQVVFTQAYSPAPGTKESLAATMRGVPVRALELDWVPSARGTVLWRDDHPTLGHALGRAGYRNITVPTHNIAEPRIGVTSGFETVWLANHDARGLLVERPPHAQSYVPSAAAYRVALRAASETPGPLCVWIHSMETHYPFHRADGSTGPTTREGFEASLREASESAATFVREFTARRGKAPIVVVFGDHGEEFGEHGGAHHATSAYAEQLRVALLVAAPGLESHTVDAPVSILEVPRTVLDLLGAEAPSTMLAPSLFAARDRDALVVGEAATPARITTVGYTRRAVRLVVDPVHRTSELFDLARDPHETHDLTRGWPGLARDLERAADRWNESH